MPSNTETPVNVAPAATPQVPAITSSTTPDPIARAATDSMASDADMQPLVTTPAAAPSATAVDTTGAVPPANASAAGAVTAKIDIPADAGPQALRDAAAGGDSKALFEINSSSVQNIER